MSKSSESYGQMTWRAFFVGLIMAGVFAWFTVLRENRPPYFTLTATNIPVLPYILLVGAVLLINPILKLTRISRIFSRVELLVIFVMGMVSNGVVSYGLEGQMIPLMSGLSSPRFNHSGVKWDVYVQPYMNEDFFIETKGTRQAAINLRDAEEEWNRAKSILKAAQNLKICREDLASAGQDLAKLDPSETAAGAGIRSSLERRLHIVQRQNLSAEAVWKPFSSQYQPNQVIDTFDRKIEVLSAKRRELKEALTRINKASVDFIGEAEHGFTQDKRAIPGFIYVPGEGWRSYSSRVERLYKGTRALRRLQEADALLAQAVASGRTDAAALQAPLADAADLLRRIGDTSALLREKDRITKKKDALDAVYAREQKKIKDLEEQGWYARASDISTIEKRVIAMQSSLAKMGGQTAILSGQIKTRIDPDLAVHERALAALEVVNSLRERAATATPADIPLLRADLAAAMATFNSFDASLRRFLAGDIEWRVWAKPTFNWGLIILLTYVVMGSFNLLIFRQWAHNEKLIYPLAELPLIIAGADEPEQTGRLPKVFKSGLFWTGFAISGGTIAWNHFVYSGAIPGASPISLNFSWEAYVDGSLFNALRGTRFDIIFCLIGLAFLVPTRVSYSMWFFQLICMAELLVMVWSGIGQGSQSFPMDYKNRLNYQLAQGGGALIIFASVMLWRCRKYLFSALVPSSVEALAGDERRELRLASAIFLGGSIALVLIFTFRLYVNIFYAILIFLLILVLTIGVVRAVAEGGVVATQAYFNPFHFICNVFGMDHSWSAPALMAPLWIYVAMLYVDIKAFIAPAMANALKIRDDMRMGRLKFHAAVCASIVAAFFVGLAVHLILLYSGGSNMMGVWQYRGGVTDLMGFGFIQRLLEERPTDPDGAKWWLLAGCVMMVFVLLLRQRFTWVLHPIGLIMLINPLILIFWGSIFIGWCFKALVSKFGNREAYQRLRYMAVGLIVGELCAAALGWARLDYWI